MALRIRAISGAERRLKVSRRITCGKEQPVALAQRYLQRSRQAQYHLATRLRSTVST